MSKSVKIIQGVFPSDSRMRNFLQAGPRQAEELGRSLLADVRTFADGRDQNDDITIMTFGRDASA